MSVLCETLSHKDSADIILKNGSLRISNNIAGMKLHEVGFYKKSRLAAAGAADHKDIFVSGILGVFRTAGHGEPFCLRQQHVIVKNGVCVGLYILCVAPSCGPVFNSFAVFLGVFPLDIDDKANSQSTDYAYK